MSILVAEDDKTSARVIELVLKKYGFKYVLAENGREALDFLFEIPQIRLIITDIMMPEMDGLELLAKIKQTRELQHLPIIMCTTKADVTTVKRAVKTGCTDYIVKPINPLQLLQKIERVMETDPPPLLEYRDLVLKTRLDRHTYTELLGRFKPLLNEKIGLVDLHLEKKKPMQEGSLDDLRTMCEKIGAPRLLELLTVSKDQLDNKTGDPDDLFLEFRLLLREMKMLRHSLPK